MRGLLLKKPLIYENIFLSQEDVMQIYLFFLEYLSFAIIFLPTLELWNHDFDNMSTDSCLV